MIGSTSLSDEGKFRSHKCTPENISPQLKSGLNVLDI
jgi:hypothetical protein